MKHEDVSCKTYKCLMNFINYAIFFSLLVVFGLLFIFIVVSLYVAYLGFQCIKGIKNVSLIHYQIHNVELIVFLNLETI
jgi:hypothetical protein